MIANQTNVEGISTAYEAMEKAELNFIPEQHELVSVHGINIPNHKAIVRSDNKQVLSVMGKDYNPFSPVETFAFADILIQKHGAVYKNVYSVDGGRKIRIEAESNGDIITGNGELDILRKRIMITDSFDGTTPLLATYGLYRPLCTNMQIWEAKETRAIRIRHTKNSSERVQQAFMVWGGGQLAFEAWEKNVKILTQKIVDKEMVNKFLNGIVGELNKTTSTRKKNQRNDIEHLFKYGKGNNGETAWDLYNGVTDYYDHNVNLDNPDARLASSLFGTGASQKTKAFNLALAL